MDRLEFNQAYLTGREPSVPMTDHLPHVEKFVCPDGFTVSVQASAYHYCSPRDSRGPWFEVECGFPSEAVPEWSDYAEDPDDHIGTVFGYVPLDKVISVLDRHGFEWPTEGDSNADES